MQFVFFLSNIINCQEQLKTIQQTEKNKKYTTLVCLHYVVSCSMWHHFRKTQNYFHHGPPKLQNTINEIQSIVIFIVQKEYH